MSQTLRILLLSFRIYGCVSAGQCAFDDDFSLVQAHARHAIEPKQKFPAIGKIVDKAKQAADSANERAKKFNDTFHITLDQATNATRTAIQAIVTTVQTNLNNLLVQADSFGDTTQQACDGFLQQVRTSPDLQTFEHAANQTLFAVDASFPPIVSALNVSIGTIQDILKVSGFLHLSEVMGSSLTHALVPIEKTLSTTLQLQELIGGLGTKVNESAGKISTEIDSDLNSISTQLHNIVEEVNTTFITKTIEGYSVLVDHLQATIEGTLEQEYLNEIVMSLNAIAPVVTNVTDHVARPLQTLEIGYDEAVNRIRESVPANARCAAGVTFISLIVIVSSSLVT